MIQILREIHKYVPTTKNADGSIKEILQVIPFGGDQLTEERAVNCKLGTRDGTNEFKQLNGLLPKIEDWHLKKTLYQVKASE